MKTRRHEQGSSTGGRGPAGGKTGRADIRERFGFAVKSRREALELTQEELAHRAGIHRTYLSDTERGTRNVGLVNVERLAAALEMTLPGLFGLVGYQSRESRCLNSRCTRAD